MGMGKGVPQVRKGLTHKKTCTPKAGTGILQVRVQVWQKIPRGYPCWSLPLTGIGMIVGVAIVGGGGGVGVIV